MSGLCNGIIFGTINSFGVLYVEVLKLYADDSDASSKASLIGSMAIGFTFLLSSVSGVLADKFGIRLIAFIGGLLATLGMLLSSFFLHRVKTQMSFITFGEVSLFNFFFRLRSFSSPTASCSVAAPPLCTRRRWPSWVTTSSAG